MVAKTHSEPRMRSAQARHAPARRQAVPSHYEYYLQLLARHAARRR